MLLTSSPPYQPHLSSPLAHDTQPSSPLSTVRAKRAGQYKSRGPPRRASTGRIVPPALGLETPEKALLRERLVARAREESRRARERAQARARGEGGWSSSDGEMSSDTDVPMDAEDDDDDNELLIGRILAAEHRRASSVLARSYDYDVGSSPGLPEDVLEELFTADVEEPPDEINYEDMYEAYMNELESINSPSRAPADGDAEMSEDYKFPVTPTRQTVRTRRSAVPRVASVLLQCPGCQTQWPSHFTASTYTCGQCSLTLSPEAMSLSWLEEHADQVDQLHRPVATALPDGIILLCTHQDCDWLYEL